jgi:poly-beta-hydroxyalkanoate depolymerase
MILSLASCSVDDNRIEFYTEFVPIESVDIPTEFVLGQVYTIYLTYLRPSGCHVFNDFYYVSDSNQRTVAIINTVYPNTDCQTFDNEQVEVSFNFIANNLETYIFRFWQGEDENGNDTYYIVEVPVVD